MTSSPFAGYRENSYWPRTFLFSLKIYLFAYDFAGAPLPCVGLCGHVWASVTVCGPLWPCVGLRDGVWASVAMCGPPWPCVGLCGHVWASVAVRGPLWPCVVLRYHAWASVAAGQPPWPCVGLLSCGTRGLPSSCGEWVAHFSGFPCGGSRAPGPQASVLVAPGLQSADSVAVGHGPGPPAARGIFRDQDRTQVACVGRQTLDPWASSKASWQSAFKATSTCCAHGEDLKTGESESRTTYLPRVMSSPSREGIFHAVGSLAWCLVKLHSQNVVSKHTGNKSESLWKTILFWLSLERQRQCIICEPGFHRCELPWTSPRPGKTDKGTSSRSCAGQRSH